VKYKGYSVYRIDQLCLPDDIATLLTDPVVRLIAATFPTVGLLHAPIVRGRDSVLVSGRRRIAALIRLGIDNVRCKVVECSDHTAHIIRCIENGCRLSDNDETTRCLTELTPKALTGIPSIYSGTRKPFAHARTAKQILARAVGMSESGVERKQQKAAYSKRGKALQTLSGAIKKAVSSMEHPPLKTLGLELDSSFIAQVGNMRLLMLSWRKQLTVMRSAITAAGKTQLFPRMQLQRLQDSLNQLQTVLSTMTPTSVCPNCKHIQVVQDECIACEGVGWIGYVQEKKVPPMLTRDQVVTYRGHVCQVSQFMPKESDAPAL
jgi:hypothetical protein